MLQDFSIYFPYITEEIFQEIYHTNKSIHTTEIKELEYNFADEIKYGDMLVEIISNARGVKTNNNVTLKTPIKNLQLGTSKELKEAIEKSSKDFKATLFIDNLEINEIDGDFEIYNVELDIEK